MSLLKKNVGRREKNAWRIFVAQLFSHVYGAERGMIQLLRAART